MYLGVYFIPKLNWNMLIQQSVSKASKMFFIHRNLNQCPKMLNTVCLTCKICLGLRLHDLGPLSGPYQEITKNFKIRLHNSSPITPTLSKVSVS